MTTQSKTLDLTIMGIGETLKELIDLSKTKSLNEKDLITMNILTDTINNLRFFNPQFFNQNK